MFKKSLEDDNYYIEFSNSEAMNKNAKDKEKFFSLLIGSGDKYLLCQVRDPIELVKHILARWNRDRNTMVNKRLFGLNDSFENIFKNYKKQFINKKIRIEKWSLIFVYQ
ncbi:hypothetical protein [Helicobacter burdigaliensis]|uniref:hypothetical protein n=1 Tax=Helicobacter burdigaliensis TaxID=2315334 RepID=UPI000EF6FA6E|nr:hypothetical protein [Helicobacter burdigaliensis]